MSLIFVQIIFLFPNDEKRESIGRRDVAAIRIEHLVQFDFDRCVGEHNNDIHISMGTSSQACFVRIDGVGRWFNICGCFWRLLSTGSCKAANADLRTEFAHFYLPIEHYDRKLLHFGAGVDFSQFFIPNEHQNHHRFDQQQIQNRFW